MSFEDTPIYNNCQYLCFCPENTEPSTQDPDQIRIIQYGFMQTAVYISCFALCKWGEWEINIISNIFSLSLRHYIQYYIITHYIKYRFTYPQFFIFHASVIFVIISAINNPICVYRQKEEELEKNEEKSDVRNIISNGKIAPKCQKASIWINLHIKSFKIVTEMLQRLMFSHILLVTERFGTDCDNQLYNCNN